MLKGIAPARNEEEKQQYAAIICFRMKEIISLTQSMYRLVFFTYFLSIRRAGPLRRQDYPAYLSYLVTCLPVSPFFHASTQIFGDSCLRQDKIGSSGRLKNVFFLYMPSPLIRNCCQLFITYDFFFVIFYLVASFKSVCNLDIREKVKC